MSVSPVVTALTKNTDIYMRKITSVMSCIKAEESLVKKFLPCVKSKFGKSFKKKKK